MQTWYTTDPHFDHEGLLKLMGRPFSSITEWNDLFLNEINTKVERHDRLFILGDFAWQNTIQKWKHRIRCRNVWLIIGNHDHRSKCKLAFGPDRVRDVFESKIRGTKVWLSHYPHVSWPGSHRGTMHLYGHIHGQREQFWDEMFPERRSMDVCPEEAARQGLGWTVFDENYIYDRLMSRKGHDPVEWYHQFQEDRRQTDPNWAVT